METQILDNTSSLPILLVPFKKSKFLRGQVKVAFKLQSRGMKSLHCPYVQNIDSNPSY